VHALRTASHDNIREARLGIDDDDCNGWHTQCVLDTMLIFTIHKPFYSEKLSNSSDLMKGKSNHVDDANFSSPLPAIIFSCKIRMERKRCKEEENDTTDTWSIVIEYLLIIAVEKSCSFPMGTQLNDFHWCSAKKVRKWSVALQRNRVTFWKLRHHLILVYGTWRWQEGSDTEFGHCSMNPQLHSHLHFILKPTKKEFGKGDGIIASSTVVK